MNKAICLTLLTTIVLTIAGCTSVYWDEKYTFEETRRAIPRTQTLQVTSTPASSFAVNDTAIGQTPRSVKLTYSADEVRFVRHQYEKKFLSSPRIINTDRKIESVNIPSIYRFQFESRGHDLFTEPVIVPYPRDTYSVTLSEAQVYWERDLRFRGIERNQARSQMLSITATPPALLHVDDKFVEKTPINFEFQYEFDLLHLVRQRYEDAQGRERELLAEEKSYEEFVRPSSHILKFQAPGYYDLYYPLSIPIDQSEITVTLDRAGVVRRPKCTVIVEAREEYFKEIGSVLERFSKERPLETYYPHPQPVENQTYKIQMYQVHPETALEYDQMVFEMRKMAREKQFVFDLIDARFEAKFSTNILEPGIQHLVSAIVRPHSDLYLAQNRNIDLIGNTSTNTTYSFTVRLRPDERNIFLVSKYKPENAQFPLVVYQQIDIFAQTQNELLAVRDFVNESGVPEARLRELDLLKP